MTSSAASADVAADFEDSLKDLQMNNRYEISTLTIIARENIQHAMAISRVLETHVKTTQSTRKLPALYVLDSIVKNVGSPYTIYLGRNLYSTFMDAYTQVDAQTRKNMESMLKTWKEPVPGSVDRKAVFPLDTVKAIENALLRAKTAYLQQQQQYQQQQQPQQLYAGDYRQQHTLPARPELQVAAQWRNTPTPPQNGGYHAPPAGRPLANAAQPNGLANQYPNGQQYPFTVPQPISTPQQSFASPDEKLKDDLEKLVISARTEFALNPYDTATQQKLKALLDLQTILNTQRLPPNQWHLIANQVNQLSQAARQALAKAHQRTDSSSSLPGSQSYANPIQAQPWQSPAPPAAALSSTNLAQILASAHQGRVPTPPVPHVAPPTNVNGMANALGVSSNVVSNLHATANPLLDSLRASGLLPAATPDPNRSSSAVTGQPYNPPPPPMASIASAISTLGFYHPTVMPSASKYNVLLTTASIKVPRPHLINALYTPYPSQCMTCGRRFPATETGRSRKARHLDFHFRTNQRMVDAQRRGVNRSWYIDELEWIQYREVDDGDEKAGSTAGLDGEQNTSDAVKKLAQVKKVPYVKAPADASMTSYACPICQEQFKSSWHDEAQEWVWTDAVNLGGRIFHGTCRDEISKDNSTPSLGRSTPESILGKRKADTDVHGGSRLKTEISVQ